MTIRYLANDDGRPFDAAELSAIQVRLDALPGPDRAKFRDGNAEHIAKHAAPRMLVVSGPGTGKSTLFRQRIHNWLAASESAGVLTLSFVRKLVEDLASDILRDEALTKEQRRRVEVYTLHRLARSIVEKSHGTIKSPLEPHFAIIGGPWKDMVWDDVLTLANQADGAAFSWKAFETQMHTAVFDDSAAWTELKAVHERLCAFYNAVGFADLILRAASVRLENGGGVVHEFVIVDEYQDFNQAEEDLIQAVTRGSRGVLIVGDDDQVLYDTLKSGKAELIRHLYDADSIANSMLPFCGRSGYHIVKAAQHFITQHADPERIAKTFLPLRGGAAASKVQVVACARPVGAVTYIESFVSQHAKEIEERKARLESGDEKDAFLLILSSAKDARFYGDEAKRLRVMVDRFRSPDTRFSEDYFRVLTYYSAANRPKDNFALRKVLRDEGVDQDLVCTLVSQAMREEKRLSEIDDGVVEAALRKVAEVKAILADRSPAEETVARLASLVLVESPESLVGELAERPIGATSAEKGRIKDEEDAELEEREVRGVSAVELMTIVGSKGLSADHVIVIGADDVNMRYVTRNAFYVAMTRARQTLHIVCALASGGSKAPPGFLSDLPDAHLEFLSFKKGPPQRSLFPNRVEFLRYLEKNQAVRASRPRTPSRGRG